MRPDHYNNIIIKSKKCLNFACIHATIPAGVYKKENFILIKRTIVHVERSHAVAIFGDIDVKSGMKILDSIELEK